MGDAIVLLSNPESQHPLRLLIAVDLVERASWGCSLEDLHEQLQLFLSAAQGLLWGCSALPLLDSSHADLSPSGAPEWLQSPEARASVLTRNDVDHLRMSELAASASDASRAILAAIDVGPPSGNDEGLEPPPTADLSLSAAALLAATLGPALRCCTQACKGRGQGFISGLWSLLWRSLMFLVSSDLASSEYLSGL